MCYKYHLQAKVFKKHNKNWKSCPLQILFIQPASLARKRNFFSGGPNGKVVAPGIVVICPIDKNRDHYTKNWLLAPNIQILGSKKHIFAPSGQLEPHRSMFSTRKRCLIGIPIRGYQNFYSLPPKNWILGPKTAKFGPKLAFWAKYRHFIIYRQMPAPSNSVKWWFEAIYS